MFPKLYSLLDIATRRTTVAKQERGASGLPDDVREYLDEVVEAVAAMVQGEPPPRNPRAALEAAISAASGLGGWQTITDVPNVLRTNIVRLRKEKGWTQQGLADQMEAAGFGWTRAIVSHVETVEPDTAQVRRQVSVTEVLGLALIFDVPLTSLLVPADGETPVEVGGRSLTPDDLRDLIERRTTDDGQEGR